MDDVVIYLHEERHVLRIRNVGTHKNVGTRNESLPESLDCDNTACRVVKRICRLPQVGAPCGEAKASKTCLNVLKHVFFDLLAAGSNGPTSGDEVRAGDLDKMSIDEWRPILVHVEILLSRDPTVECIKKSLRGVSRYLGSFEEPP